MTTKKIYVVTGEHAYGHKSLHMAFSSRERAKDYISTQQTTEEANDPYGYFYSIVALEFDDYKKVKDMNV